jgi:hypothetical protein
MRALTSPSMTGEKGSGVFLPARAGGVRLGLRAGSPTGPSMDWGPVPGPFAQACDKRSNGLLRVISSSSSGSIGYRLAILSAAGQDPFRRIRGVTALDTLAASLSGSITAGESTLTFSPLLSCVVLARRIEPRRQ